MKTRVNTPAATEGTAQYYAEYLTKHADKKKPVILRTGSRYHVFVFKGDFWDMSSADGRTTQYDLTTDEAADVLAEFYKDAQRAPLYKAEEITRTADGIDRTADGLEFRAVVVGCESLEIEAAFLTLEDAHAAGWYGFKLDADPAEVCNGSEGYRGGRLLLECCREEDAGTFKIAYGETYEQAAANYRAGRFGLSVVMEPAETISTPTRAKAQTYQDKPAADTLPDDLPADVLKFYEVNRDASDENPAPVCLFWHNNTHSYTAYGSDAHILRDELGKVCATFTTETEYKHGKHYPAPIDFADIERDELPAALHWLTREGYAVAVFAAADCLPTLNPAAPDWQERDKARRGRRYSETLELGDGITRIMESERNMYDFHYNLNFRYYKGGDLLAMFHATGYPEKWDYIGTIRPPHAGRFSNGQMVEHFGTIWQAERYILAEIAKGLQPYNMPTE